MSKDKFWIFGSEHEVVSNTQSIRGKEKYIEETMRTVSDFFENEVEWHFRKEENGLFPILQEVIGEERRVIDETLASHPEFRQMYKQLLSSMKRSKEFLMLIDRMMDFLETHGRSEGSTLFPIVNKLLNKDQMNEVLLKIIEIERESNLPVNYY